MLVLQVGWRTGPWACRSLAAAGFDVVGGHEHARLIGRTRRCRTLYRYPSPTRETTAFLRQLQGLCERHAIAAVLPLDDDVVDLLARSRDLLGETVVVAPTAEQFAALCDKRRLTAAALRAGFSTPAGTVVRRSGPEGDWPPLPSIVKPRCTSAETAAMVARKPQLVRTRESRDRAVRAGLRVLPELLVEEQVRGRAWRVHFVRARDGLACLVLRAVRNFPVGTGQSTVQTVAGTSAPPDLLPAARRLLDHVGYLGPGSIQAFERADGRLVVHDVNLRLPVTVALTMRSGFDMPRIAVESALGRPLAQPSKGGCATYVALDEVRQLVASIGRREGAAPARRVAADLCRAVVHRDAILDPFDLADPLPTALAFRELALALRRDWSSR